MSRFYGPKVTAGRHSRAYCVGATFYFYYLAHKAPTGPKACLKVPQNLSYYYGCMRPRVAREKTQ